jgi:beta-glucosidase-like glycosyl hydrolase
MHGYGWPYDPGVYGGSGEALATVFSQVIGLAASFNRTLWYGVGQVASIEARAYYNYHRQQWTNTSNPQYVVPGTSGLQ